MRQAKIRPSRLRYTKAALLLFGAGLVLGFVVVVGEFTSFERVASILMAAALVMLPVALFADSHGMALVGRIAAQLPLGRRPKSRSRKQPSAGRRKPAAPRRRRG